MITVGDRVILTTAAGNPECWKDIAPVPEGKVVEIPTAKKKHGIVLVRFPGYTEPVTCLTLNLRKVKDAGSSSSKQGI